MKTISSRFLKASLAMFLVVVMLFGSTITGFAASVDNADTKANVDKTEIGSTIGNMSDVYFTGEFNGWSTSSHKLTKHDANHYSGTFYIARGDGELSFKLYIVGPNWSGYFSKGNSSYGSNTTTTSLEQGQNDDKISCVTAASGFIKITVDFYGEYGGNSRLNIKQSAVSQISVSVNPTSTTLTSGETVTINPSATGGTGSFSYSYAKSGGTLSATSGSSTVFTAPTVTSNTTYTVTTTVKDSNCSGLTATVTTTITVKPKTYTVTYNTNGGTGNIASQTKTHGVALTLTSSKPTPPSGKTFKEWNTKQDGTGTAYAPGASYTANAAVTLYAQYTISDVYYTFYDYDKTTVLKEKTKITSGGTPVPPASPTRDHYTFAGWSPAVNPITQDTNYYATYTPFEYTITFNTDGADAIDPTTYTIETETFELPTPEKTGYDFIKWVDGNNNEYSSIAKGSTGDLELTAIYKIKTYTISVEVSPAGAGEATANDGSSATVEHGQEVTLKAVAKDGYRFKSWQLNGSNVNSDVEYTVTPTATATYTAVFEKVWNLTVEVPEGVSHISFSSTGTSSNHSYTVADQMKATYRATVDTGYRLIGWDITKNGETKRYNTETIEVTVDADTTITPVVEKLYYAVVNGNSPTATDYYVKGQEVTLSFTVPTGKYLASVSVEPAMELDVNVDKAAGKVTFTMPEADVRLVPTFEDAYTVTFNPDVFTSTTKKDYYYPGEPVEITVTPKGGHLITSITSEQTDVTYANKVITFTMPAENVTLDVEYSASFKAYSEVTTVHIDPDGPNVHTGYDNRVQGGTVIMTCNGATLAEDGFADGDVTYTATPSSDYIFVGYYSDAEYKKFITAENTYTISPESDVTLYALFARRQYIKIGSYSYYEMAFDRTLKAYTMTYTNNGPTEVGTVAIGTTFNNGFDIRVSYATSGKDTVYADWDSADFHLTMNNNSYARTVSWGSAIWHIGSAQANTSAPLTIIVKPDSITDHNHIDVSARAKKSGATVFLSDGRWKNYNASTTILTEGVTGEDKVIGHDGDSEEYKKINLSEFKTLSWETTINHADAKYLYVESYIVYKLESKTWEIVKPVSLGNNKYQGSVYVDGDCYIVPIFFYNDDYCTDKDYVNIELYFDASAIQNLKWGPFVSAYAWGSDKAYFGSWPGQLLIPTPDGKSFYTQMAVPAAGSANPAAGVTFNNYLFATCPTNEADTFGLGTSNVQTYDYREAITLYEAGYEVITFVAKTSKDGYHGDEPNGVTQNIVEAKNYSNITTEFTFDYLYCRDGESPMDFTGNPVEDTLPKKAVTSADYYVVSKGDRDIDAGGYTPDPSYNGDWSVEWYIFDSNGNYKTKVLSTALWHDTTPDNDDHTTVLLNALGLTPEQAAGKTVAISYEHHNQADAGAHQLAYDGQWYGNMLDHTVTGQVIVGLEVDEDVFEVKSNDPLNIADYGEAYLDDLNGGLHQKLDIQMEYGIADLTATPKSNYRFVGWYTQKADGTYVPLNPAASFSTYINMNETYYAIFRELGDEEVSITHTRYVNSDPAIPSHDGVGELSVEVRDSHGTLVANGPISTYSSAATFTANEGEEYTVKIITTPLMRGKFFAWYTDSVKADGTKTYEEVFTEPEHIDSESTVYAEFEYVYDSENEDLQKNITIYSDIRKVSNEAKLYYQYTNRFGATRTYTTKVTLSNDECMGYVGNDNMEYCPTWLTWCTFLNESTDDEIEEYVKPSELAARSKELSAQGYVLVDTYNLIEALAPTEDVTEVFNGTVEWDVSVNLTAKESEVRLTAKQGAPQYTITYYIGKGTDNVITDSFTKSYNELVEIDAPAVYNGENFSYWFDETTNEIAAYTTYYNYRVVEDKTIVAVYGDNVTQDWTPSINSVTYTREFGDSKDVIYTDYLLAYNNKDGKILNEWKKTDNIKYGLLVVRDSAYYIEDSNNVTYPDSSNKAINDKLKLVAQTGSSAAFTVDNTKYNCYCYDLTENTLTNFNRCDYYREYDNRAVVGGSHYYREYAFTAVAYIIVNGEVFLSNPREVNFFDLGNEVPTNPVQ